MNGQQIIWTSSTLLIVLTLVILNLYSTEIAILLAIKWTARTSFFYFYLTFIASSIYHFIPNRLTTYIVRHRRYLGLSFFVSHFIHLLLIIGLIFIVYNGNPQAFRSIIEFIPGGIVYVFIFLLALTSNNSSINFLGLRKWKQLHTIGSYLISFSFLNGFTSRISLEHLEYVLFSLIIIISYILRFTHWRNGTKHVL
jgi:sulfoxide reductase heme-binding subunit YedZ